MISRGKIAAASGGAEAEGVFGVGGGSSFHGLEGDWGEPACSCQGKQADSNRGLADAGICSDKEDAAEGCRAGLRRLGERSGVGGRGLGCGLDNSRGGGVYQAVDLVKRDREWRHENHHGAERAQDDPVTSDDSADTRSDGLLSGVGLGVRAPELDANHEALLADFEDMRERRYLLVEAGAQGGDFGGQVGECLLALEQVEGSQRGSAAEGVAAETVAVEEGEALFGQSEELTEHDIGDQGCGDREVSSAEALGEGEEIGGDAFLLAREHGASAAKAGRDLVGDKENVVFVAEGSGFAQEARGRQEHSRCALNQGLKDKCC